MNGSVSLQPTPLFSAAVLNTHAHTHTHSVGLIKVG